MVTITHREVTRGFALILGAFLWMGSGVASAQGLPIALEQFDVARPGGAPMSIAVGRQRVDFGVTFRGRSAGIDVTAISGNTSFAVDFGVECTGGQFTGTAAVNQSPLSRRDDTFSSCPRGTRPVRVFGAIGILDR